MDQRVSNQAPGSATAEGNSQGTIVQCIGAVVDVQFPRENMPHVYDALTLEADPTNKLVEQGLTFEVQQQLGDGVVRCIALGSSDGLRRGMKVRGTGAPISVPVGKGTLGRIMDVLGRPIDEVGPIKSGELRSIHQIAPKFDELTLIYNKNRQAGITKELSEIVGGAAAV
jgi:F-type H+-transporting ATPase subunit beta